MEYLWAWGTLINEKNRRSKISCQTPFKARGHLFFWSRQSTKYVHIKSTTVYAPRRNWDSPNPFLASECSPPPETGGRGHTSLRVGGWGESQFRRGAYTVVLFICTYFVRQSLVPCTTYTYAYLNWTSSSYKGGGWNWYQSIGPIKLSGQQVFKFSFAILMRQYRARNIKLFTASKQHLLE
jgi:hypothetical protein